MKKEKIKEINERLKEYSIEYSYKLKGIEELIFVRYEFLRQSPPNISNNFIGRAVVFLPAEHSETSVYTQIIRELQFADKLKICDAELYVDWGYESKEKENYRYDSLKKTDASLKDCINLLIEVIESQLQELENLLIERQKAFIRGWNI